MIRNRRSVVVSLVIASLFIFALIFARPPQAADEDSTQTFVIPAEWGELKFAYQHPNVGGTHYLWFVADDGTVRRVLAEGKKPKLLAVYRRQD